MKRFVRSIIILLFPIAAFSQKEYFIYLQSEEEQPFFVRLADQTYNSSPRGYLILAKLRDTTHAFKIGFPQNKWPDQQFNVAIRSKDHGYLLKNFNEKGWGLFDLQSMSVQMSTGSTAARNPVNTGTAEVSAFTEILAKAANDPSLREKPVFASVTERPRDNQPVINSKTEPVAMNVQAKENKPDKPVVIGEKTDITDRKELKKDEVPVVAVKTEDSLGMSGTKDIVAVSEPVQKTPDSLETKPIIRDTISMKQEFPVAKKEREPVMTTKTPVAASDTVIAQRPVALIEEEKKEGVPIKEKDKKGTEEIDRGAEPVSNETKISSADYERSEVIKKSESSTTEGFGLTFIDKIADFRQDTIRIIIPNPKTILAVRGKSQVDDKRFLDITSDDSKAAVKKDPLTNNCPSFASENDFFKLRKKMAGEKESEAMINEARKEFRSKCFSVEQIRNLGNLFLNEAGKFQFYEAAYSHSSDKPGFLVLETEFKDPYFVHRFKNLVN